MPRLSLPLGLLVAALLPATASAAVPAGADYEERYIPTPDGESLHVDVLRPKGVTAKTPVIAIVSPYLGHSVDGKPSERFKDFLDGAKVFEKGYSVVMVDLRGSGGSSGCLDILGPGEQTDIKTAVEWAAKEPWSNGRVGMYGKSYDGNTGVAGAALRPEGLHAVVAQQVVGDRYSGSYSNGVRYLQSLAYPFVSYGTQAEGGWTEEDDERYFINSFSRSADCQAGLAGHYDPNRNTDFWRSRDFVEKGRGSTVPFLMTTGFLDANTNIGAKAIDFYNGLAGEKRLWLGWWDHVRGNDLEGDQLAMGRPGWFEEVMRFYDKHLKGIQPSVQDPAVVVQGSDGAWRSEQKWPPADVRTVTAKLGGDNFLDDGNNLGSKDLNAGAGGAATSSGTPYRTGFGAWTISEPLPHAAHLAGIPRAAVDVVAAKPDADVTVNVYDIAPDGMATMVTRGASQVRAAGDGVPMYPSDWQFAPGHRIGVLISGSNAEAWLHQNDEVLSVAGGEIELPFLRTRRGSDLPGTPAPRLAEFKRKAPFPVHPNTLAQPAAPGLIPPAQVDPPAGRRTDTPAAAPSSGGDAAPGAGFASSITGRAGALRYRVRFTRRPLRTALRRGIRATATCSARCTMTVALTVDKRTAKRLKLKSRRVATGRLARPFSGSRKLTITFNRTARRRLARTRRLKLAVAVVARDAAGRRAASRGTMSLRR